MSVAPIAEGFETQETDGATLHVDSRHAEAVIAAGLGESRKWLELLAVEGGQSGRGANARLALRHGPHLVLKQMKRGGLLASVWRDRYPGDARLLENVRVPLEAIRRGLATPPPVALLVRSGPPGLCRGWIAFEEVEGAVDLARCFGSALPPTRATLEPALRLVRRMHDLGIEHRDLNLGNLLIRERDDGIEAHVVDLDRARLHTGGLRFELRQAALRRLERSYVKLCSAAGRTPVLNGLWYELYCGQDAGLRERLDRGRRAGRLLLRLHRLGW